jgi:hypothetical protein
MACLANYIQITVPDFEAILPQMKKIGEVSNGHNGFNGI